MIQAIVLCDVIILLLSMIVIIISMVTSGWPCSKVTGLSTCIENKRAPVLVLLVGFIVGILIIFFLILYEICSQIGIFRKRIFLLSAMVFFGTISMWIGLVIFLTMFNGSSMPPFLMIFGTILIFPISALITYETICNLIGHHE